MESEEVMCAIGALTEIAGFLLDQLLTNGFEREEAVNICEKYIIKTLFP